jgi:hypothetical protein
MASLFFVFNSGADTAWATIETRATRLDKPFACRRSVCVAIGARADAANVVVVIIARSARATSGVGFEYVRTRAVRTRARESDATTDVDNPRASIGVGWIRKGLVDES